MSTIATGARQQSFDQVEAPHAQFGDNARINDAQHQGADNQHECGGPAGTS
jgi:hypothetical protein